MTLPRPDVRTLRPDDVLDQPQLDELARFKDAADPERIPRHIAVIMDGNGRWAQARGRSRTEGHLVGAEAALRIARSCGVLGVDVLTLYSFSLENWKRPQAEVEALMSLCTHYLARQKESLIREGVRLRVIGRREGLPAEVRDAIADVEEATSTGDAATVCLALNYGSRAEIADAAREIARKAAAGLLSPDDVDEDAFARHLYTHDLPDPDLVIRTAGEKRVSNYLLWQISYAELHVTQTLWPDFSPRDLTSAIRDYASRNRRFGGLTK